MKFLSGGIKYTFIIFILFFCLVSMGTEKSNPDSFHGIYLNFSHQEIIGWESINLESPALFLNLMLDGRLVDVSVLYLTDDEVTGGIHTFLEINPQELLELLAQDRDFEDVEIVRQIMGVTESTLIKHIKQESIDYYIFIGVEGDYSAIYVFQSCRRGAIMLAGNFDLVQAELMVSRLM